MGLSVSNGLKARHASMFVAVCLSRLRHRSRGCTFACSNLTLQLDRERCVWLSNEPIQSSNLPPCNNLNLNLFCHLAISINLTPAHEKSNVPASNADCEIPMFPRASPKGIDLGLRPNTTKFKCERVHTRVCASHKCKEPNVHWQMQHCVRSMKTQLGSRRIHALHPHTRPS